MSKKHYRSIFISDSHFGYPINRSDLLANFLSNHTCDNLYLVGDIIDFWVLKEKPYWKYEDSLAAREIIHKTKHSKTFYIPGNHDDILRPFLEDIHIAGVIFANELTHEGIDGKKYLVVHGDIFDSTRPVWDALSHIGNHAYMAALWINKKIITTREKFGWEPWSLSQYLKHNVKSAVNYITKFEDHMFDYAKEKQYDGVICGHIHTAGIKTVDHLDKENNPYTLKYMNCGDWVESCTALVEHDDGTFEIIEWMKKR
jgi:UDP-2,3-diacylglucosamine pyrophosphatase LpxH